MNTAAIDAAFEQFRASGDPAALAIVFDATAPELLRLAWHLTGDRHSAEDAVQATFLVAIEHARSFQPGRRVLPWLCGVLANCLRDARRRRRREQRSIPIGARCESEDPAVRAELGELAAAATERLRALPEPYRQTMLLLLEHGLGAQEIAELRGIPAPTVRSHVHRALGMLRRSLPAALGIAAAAPVWAARDLAALRSKLLAHSGIGTGSGICLGGAVAMKKWIAAVVVLVLVAAWLADPFGSAQAPAESAVGTAPDAMSNEPVGAAATPAAPAREPIAGEPGIEPQLVVTVRRERDRSPLAGCTVHWVPQCELAELFERTAQTDASGVAEFSGLPAGPARLLVDRGGQASIELGSGRHPGIEILVPDGVRVRVRVMDPDQRPIGGAVVWLSRLRNSIGDGDVVGRTSPEGTLDLDSVEPERVVSAWAEGFAAAPAQAVPAPAAEPAALAFNLQPVPGTLVGTVVDPDGRPVANALVLFGLVHGHWPNLVLGPRSTHYPDRLTRSDPNGRFRIDGLRAQAFAVPLWARAPNLAASKQSVRIRADAPTVVEIRLQRGAQITGRATFADGRPVQGAAIRDLHVEIEPKMDQADQSPRWARSTARTGQDGSFALDQLMPGRRSVLLEWNASVANAEFDLADGQQSVWNPVLGAGERIHGTVVDTSGRALAGWQVRGKAPGGGLPDLRSVRTGADGSFELSRAVAPEYELLVIAPQSAMSNAALRLGGIQPGPDPLRIEVPPDRIPSAEITLRVLGPDGAPLQQFRGMWVCLAPDGSASTAGHEPGNVQDGRLTVGPLLPGRYEIVILSDEFGRMHLQPVEVVPGARVDLGTRQYGPPGMLQVEVIREDRKPAQQAVVIRREGEQSSSLILSSLIPGVGGPARASLQPGTYVLSTWGTEMPCATTRVEVVSGRTTEVQLVAPVSHRILIRHCPAPADDYWLREIWIDATGRVAFESGGGFGARKGQPTQPVERRLPAGRYTLELCDGAGASASLQVTVDPLQPDRIVELPPLRR